MRILQILPEMNVGGVETGTMDLSIALRRDGHEVFVVSHGGTLVPRLLEAGVRHINLPVHRKEPFTMLGMAWVLRRLLHRHRIDIVHARSRVPGWIAYFATRRTKAQLITTAHGAYRTHMGSRVMAWGRRVIAPSRAIALRMHREFEVPPERMDLLPRGVDVRRFAGLRRPRIAENGPIVVGMVGRITALKGHEVFLHALALARKTQPRLVGRIVGSTPAHRPAGKEELIHLAQGLGLGDVMRFEEARPDVERVYEELDMLVLASLIPESFGRVLVEAQASGVPVLASALGGALEIVEEGRTGTLFPMGDVDALAEALCHLADHPDKANAMAEKAWEKAEREYTVERMVRGTLAVYEEVLRPNKVLVLKFGSLGDVLLSEPALHALRKKYPRAHLAVMVKERYREVLADCPHIDQVIAYQDEGRHRGPGLVVLAQELREEGFDLLVDMQNNHRSHLFGAWTGIRRRVGYARKGGRIFLNDPVEEPSQKMDPISHQFYLLNRLGIRRDGETLQFHVNAEDENWAESFLRQRGSDLPLAAVHVGGSPRWITKQWGLDSFARLIDSLPAKVGMQPLLVGGTQDRPLVEKLRGMAHGDFADAVGHTSVRRLAALLRRCEVLVGADSTPLHVASAAGVPFVALFGPTDPARHAPPGKGMVLFKNPPCGPCYRPVCPEGHHRCMKDIALGEVLEAIQSFKRQTAEVPA